MRQAIAVALAASIASGFTVFSQAPGRSPATAEQFDRLFHEVKNWGRWGADDQLGSVNLITPAKRKQALSLARTGQTSAVGRSAAGFHASIIPFIKARGVAIVGSDAASEVTPSMVEGVALPVHTLLITALGVNILDNQDLEAVAEVAAKLKRWEFMIAIHPLAVTGGTGSPINTLAVF